MHVALLEDESSILDKFEEDDKSSAISLRLNIYQWEGDNSFPGTGEKMFIHSCWWNGIEQHHSIGGFSR